MYVPLIGVGEVEVVVRVVVRVEVRCSVVVVRVVVRVEVRCSVFDLDGWCCVSSGAGALAAVGDVYSRTFALDSRSE